MKIRYINHNIIILISSYPFISLINCPWLLFHGIILLSYSYFWIKSNFGCREDDSVNKSIILYTFTFTLLALIASFLDYWIRDVIREVIKIYEVLPAGLFIVFLLFVFSEGMLFLSFF